ncbi:MAG: HDIG domain-containing protein [Candidatus Bathyarchaeia archaeon]
MSDELPSKTQALQLLIENNCTPDVIEHCKAVAKLATEIAENCLKKGLSVNIDLVEIGAILHDIGRSKTHSVHHALIGAQILRSAGLPEALLSIVKRHVGGGITKDEAEQLGWPKDVYIPQTLEEKIVSYADKMIEKSTRIPIEITIDALAKKHGQEAAERVRKLHTELAKFIGDCP